MIDQKIKRVYVVIILVVIVLIVLTPYYFGVRRTPVNIIGKKPFAFGKMFANITITDSPKVCNERNCSVTSEFKAKNHIELSPTISRDDTEPGPLTIDQLRRKFLETPYILDKFTIVTPSFKRTENLYKLFENYCKLKEIVHKIIILWNNVGEAVPDKVTTSAAKCDIPVIIKIMPKNNLTSRFYVYPEIETTGSTRMHVHVLYNINVHVT